MPVNTPHPLYEAQEKQWVRVRDVITGEAVIYKKITEYLPCPPGLLAGGVYDVLSKQGTPGPGGLQRYNFYASFAEFPELASETLNGLQGLIHEKDPVIELPKDLEYLLQSAMPDGGDLLQLWEKVTRELLTTGRIQLLNEITPDDKILLCPYVAESMINFRVARRDQMSPEAAPIMIVFKECELIPDESDPYKTVEQNVYRELYIAEDEYRVRVYVEKEGDATPTQVFRGEEEQVVGYVSPVFFGESFDMIPITVINALDVGFTYGPIPIKSVVMRVLSIFRRSADYNRALYLKGDPQAVVTGVRGADVPTTIGGSEIWCFSDPNATASYMDIDGQGIPMMRQAILDQYDLMARETMRLVDDGKGVGPESGEAVRRKNASRQVTLKAVVMNGGTGIEKALKLAARMRGMSEADINKIKFSPHVDFAEPTLPAEEVIKLTAAMNLGAPISKKSAHENFRRGRLTDMSYPEEVVQIQKEMDGPLGGPLLPVAPPRVDNRLGAQPGAVGSVGA